jgi:hypothetical protein
MAHAKGTKGTFGGFKCVVILEATGDCGILLEFDDILLATAGFGWLGKTRPDLDVYPANHYWFDHYDKFVPDVPWQEKQPWVLDVDKIMPATYHGIPCKVLPHRGRTTVVEFDTQPKEVSTWIGTQKDSSDPDGILPNKYYHYVRNDSDGLIIDRASHGYNCCECHGRNEHAQPNLTENRFICWGCATSWRWKYEGCFLPGHRYHTIAE